MFKGIIFTRNEWINFPFEMVDLLALELGKNYSIQRQETGEKETAQDFRLGLLGLMNDALPSIPANQPFGGALVAFTEKSWREYHKTWADRLATPLKQRFIFTDNETGEPVTKKFFIWLIGNLTIVKMDWESEKFSALEQEQKPSSLT